MLRKYSKILEVYLKILVLKSTEIVSEVQHSYKLEPSLSDMHSNIYVLTFDPTYAKESKDNDLFKSFKCHYEDKHLNKRKKRRQREFFERGKKIGF